MGGFGSGRRWGKAVTAGHRQLDIRLLQKNGQLISGNVSSVSWPSDDCTRTSIVVFARDSQLLLRYQRPSWQDEWITASTKIDLAWTTCNFGGQRAWFLCPGAECGRRVALLYIGNSGGFLCRHCHQLAYRCQRETSFDRSLRRANKIRKKLGWSAGISNPAKGKPKGMHWVTYYRLVDRLNSCAAFALADLQTYLGETTDR